MSTSAMDDGTWSRARTNTTSSRWTPIARRIFRPHDHAGVLPDLLRPFDGHRVSLTINVGSVPGDRRLINGLATTMATVFPSIHIMDIPGTLNTMIFATKQPTNETRISRQTCSMLLTGAGHSSAAADGHANDICQHEAGLRNHAGLHRRPGADRMDRQRYGCPVCVERPVGRIRTIMSEQVNAARPAREQA